MGAKASKPARKLGDSVSKTANSVNRSSKINQLPSQSLKHQYEQHYIQQQAQQAQSQTHQKQSPTQDQSISPQDQSISQQPVQETPDESLNQAPAATGTRNNQFDAKFLSKKLKQAESKRREHGQPKPPASEPSEAMPEGKDGFDPQMGNRDGFDPNFVSSINHLGKQIQSHTYNPKFGSDISALNQLKNRKSLYEKGQKELEHQMGQPSEQQAAPLGEVTRTMIHPRTLGAILNDLKDPRVSNDQITKDYQLHPQFLAELGTRFKVANNVVIIEEDAKEGEIAPKLVDPRTKAQARVGVSVNEGKMMDYDGELSENVNVQRLKTLQTRLGIDEEEPHDEPQQQNHETQQKQGNQ